MNKTISTSKAIIAIVVLAIIVFGAVFAYQYYWQVLEEEVETPADETADWETYRNEEYGFEFKYPSGLEFQEEQQNKYYNEFYKITISGAIVNFSIRIKENVYSLEELKMLRENELTSLFKGISDLDVISWKDTTLLGLEAKELNFRVPAGGEPMVWETLIIKDSVAYIFSSGNSDSSEQYYKILSTFKFID